MPIHRLYIQIVRKIERAFVTVENGAVMHIARAVEHTRAAWLSRERQASDGCPCSGHPEHGSLDVWNRGQLIQPLLVDVSCNDVRTSRAKASAVARPITIRSRSNNGDLRLQSRAHGQIASIRSARRLKTLFDRVRDLVEVLRLHGQTEIDLAGARRRKSLLPTDQGETTAAVLRTPRARSSGQRIGPRWK